ATAPAKMASAGVASAAQAVDVTRPASQPLAQRLASGLPKRNCVTAKVATNAAAAESNVLMAVPGSAASGACSQITAPAAFHASQPTSASRQPNRTYTALWPGIAVDRPSRGNLPRRGPAIHTRANAVSPPRACTVAAPPASKNPAPNPKFAPNCASHPP